MTNIYEKVCQCIVGLCIISHTVGLKLLETTYDIHSVQIDNKNNFEAAIFTFTFDESLTFVPINNPSKTYGQTDIIAASNNTANLCFSPIPCFKPSNISCGLYDMLTLHCPSQTIGSAPILPSDLDNSSPPSYLVLFQGGSKEPLLSFFAPILNISGDLVAVNSTQLHALLILRYTGNGIPFLVGGEVRTVDLGQCTFTFQDSDEYYLLDSNQAHFSGTSGQIKQAYSPPCSYFNSLAVSQTMVDTINNMSNVNTWTDLQLLRFQVALLESSNSLTVCQDIINNYIDTKTQDTIFPNTTDCLKDISDPSFATDPCCNTTLQFYYCCASGDKVHPIQILEDVNANVDKCMTKDKSSAVLNDYISNTNSALDPFSGCRATSAEEANTATVDRYTSFIDECLFRVYGSDLINGRSPYPCNNDSDCLNGTYCTIFKTCYVDYVNIDDIMLDCQLSLIDPLIVKLLKVEWNLPIDISDSAFRQAYFNNMSSENCVGFSSGLYTWFKDSKGDLQWITNQESACLADTYCNHLDDPSCNQTGFVCLANGIYSGFGQPITYDPFCMNSYVTPDDCEASGGVYRENADAPCYFPQYNFSECLPSSICPALVLTDNNYFLNCLTSLCYDPSLTEVQCTAPAHTWLHDWANGTGLCQVSNVTSADTCESATGTWWDGRGWDGGYFYTKELCEAGLCLEGTTFTPASEVASCDTDYSCSQYCHSCVSTNYVGDMCYTTEFNANQCAKLNGTFEPTYQLCRVGGQNVASCAALGSSFTFASCTNLTKDQCDSCETGGSCPQYFDLMACEYSWEAVCPDEYLCETNSGICTDYSLLYYPDGCNVFTDDCYGFCLQDLVPYANGQWACQNPVSVYTPLGCIVDGIYTQTNCTAQNYTWYQTAMNQKECEARKECQLPDSTINLQNATQCNECHGTYQPVFTWSKGEWKSAKKLAGTWTAKNVSHSNVWRKTLDYKIITDTINRVIAQKFALAVQTESMCLYYPMFEAMSHIVCDCAHDISAPPQCYNDGIRLISVGVQRFYAGIHESIKANSIGLTVFDTTVPVELAFLDVDIEICYASQFRLKQSLSTDALSASLANNPFAVVKNSHDATVGQLVGDGAVITFLPPDSSPKISLSSHAVFSRDFMTPTIPPPTSLFQLKKPMRVCVALRGDIPKSSHDFPVPDIALTTNNWTTWTPQNVQVNVTDQGYCFMATKDGRYFPILRVADFLNKRNTVITDKTLRAFIYIFGVWMLLLAFVCAYQIWFAARNVRTSHKLNLALVLFFFMLLFVLVRGIYLLILPSGRLANHEGAKYFLSEAPQFFFYSVYSVIIFAWAELSLTVAPRSFLQRFKWPFVITNVLLYLFFIIVVSIYHSLSADSAVTLRKVYVFLLAACCIVAVIAFNVFGIKLISVQVRAKRATTVHTANRSSTLKKLFVLLPVSSVSILAQIAFLFVITYTYVSPQVALTAYVITEVIPATTLIFTLRPLSRKLSNRSEQNEQKGHPPDGPSSSELVENSNSSGNINNYNISNISDTSGISGTSNISEPPNIAGENLENSAHSGGNAQG